MRKKDLLGGAILGILAGAACGAWADMGLGIPDLPYLERLPPVPTLDFDFANGTYSQLGTPSCVSAATCLTDSRPRPTSCADLSGNYIFPANNVPCITNAGLSIWEQRTNSIRNSTMQGAIAGTPGTLPTNWIEGMTAGLTVNVIGTGVTSGIAYIDLELTGNATGSITIQQEGNQSVAAAQGQNWASSMFVALVGGSLTNLSSWSVGATERDASGAQLSGGYGQTFTPASLARIVATGTLTNASTAFIAPKISVSTAGAIEATIRIGGPQLEGTNVTFASPLCPTSTVAVTCHGDVISATQTIGASYTTFASGVPAAPAAAPNTQFMFAISDGGLTNRSNSVRAASTGVAAQGTGGTAGTLGDFSWNGGTINASPNLPQNTTAKTAIVYTGASGLNTVTFGARTDGSFQWNGTITHLSLWPQLALTDNQLLTVAK